MRKKKYIFIASTLFFIFVLYNGFGLVKSKGRPSRYPQLSQQIKNRIKNECKETDPEKCAKYSLKLTSELLSFSIKNDINNGEANCEGYAILCSWICNYALKVNHLEYKSKPVVGYVTFYGVNLCDVLKAIVPKGYKNFVKDHDFVELELDEKIMLFDASLYGYHIKCTTYQ